MGDQWCGWKVFYDFCRHIGVLYTTDQDALLDLWLAEAQHCHWWWPYEGIVLASERPVRLHVDEQGRLHHSSGPAIAYADGWSLYAWHGLRLDDPDVILRPETITVDRIRAEENVELRRVLVERYGWDRYLADSGALPVHTDECGTLYRCAMTNDEDLVVVSVVNRTSEPAYADGLVEVGPGQWARRYIVRVTPTVQTARAAVASSYGLQESQYRPVHET